MTGARRIAAILAVLSLAAAADPGERLQNPAAEARARALFTEIRCVVCQNESIDDSEADLARDLRMTVRRQVAAGRSDAEIKAFLVRRYGEFILLRPVFSLANALAWLTPFAIVVVGLGVFITRAARRPRGPDAEALTPEEAERLQRIADRN